MSKRTPYLERIRDEVRNGTVHLPSEYEIANSESYECVRSFCTEHTLDLKRMSMYKIVGLHEALMTGGFTTSQIAKDVFGCEDVAQMAVRYYKKS